MPNDITLRTFPSSVEEALAFLYIQHQDLSGKSPEEIHTMYQEAYYAIRKDHYQKWQDGWFKAKGAEVRQP